MKRVTAMAVRRCRPENVYWMANCDCGDPSKNKKNKRIGAIDLLRGKGEGVEGHVLTWSQSSAACKKQEKAKTKL